MKTTEAVAKALLRLSKNEDYKVVVEFHRETLAELDRNTRRMTGDKLLIENGKRIAYEKMIAEVDEAANIVQKLTKKVGQ